MEKSPSEIVKLTERISKDPKSKLFVPLAEEYKKIGDVEMAIHVLSEGLKQNPTYITARSLLGRFLLESGDFVAAQKELEEVVRVMPDNLLARKKLGDIYLRQNKQGEALQQYRAALNLNPVDKAFALQVSELEIKLKKPAVPASSEELRTPAADTAAVVKEPEEQKAPSSAAEKPVASEEPKATEATREAEQNPQTRTEDAKTEQEETTAKSGEPAVNEPAGALSAAVLGEAEEPEEVVEFEPLEEEIPAAPHEVAPVAPAPDTAKETTTGSEHDELTSPLTGLAEGAPSADDIKSEAGAFENDVIPLEETGLPVGLSETLSNGAEDKAAADHADIPSAVDAISGVAEPVVAEKQKAGDEKEAAAEEHADEFTTDTLAELYIAQGFYEKAIDIYQRMVADHPNSSALQNKLARVRKMAAAEGESAEAAHAVPERFYESPQPAPEPEVHTFGIADEKTAKLPEASSEEQRTSFPPDASAGARGGESAETDGEELTLDAEIVVDGEDNISEIEKTAASAAEKRAAAFADIPSFPDAPSPDILVTQRDTRLDEHTPFSKEFEPKEYIPPDALLKQGKKTKAPAVSLPSVASKKEAIERLEKWLSTIKKEK